MELRVGHGRVLHRRGLPRHRGNPLARRGLGLRCGLGERLLLVLRCGDLRLRKGGLDRLRLLNGRLLARLGDGLLEGLGRGELRLRERGPRRRGRGLGRGRTARVPLRRGLLERLGELGLLLVAGLLQRLRSEVNKFE